MRGAWPSSLRSRLTLGYVALLGVPLVAFAVICYLVLASMLVSRTDRFIAEALTVVAREVVAERRSSVDVPEAIRTTLDDMRFRNLRIIVRDAAGHVMTAVPESAEDARADSDVVLSHILSAGVVPETVTVKGASRSDRVLSVPLDVHGERYVLAGVSPLADVYAVLERIRLFFFAVIPLLLAAAAGSAFLLVHRGLAPMTAMMTRAGEISASNLHARLPVAGDAELAGLARVVNELLDRIETAFEQQRRFMADASHELRTPTAIIRTEADVTLARERRDEAEYRESVGVMRDAAARLSRIVDDLFLLARADAGRLEARREPVYLEEVVDDATRAMAPVAEARGVRIELRNMAQAPVVGDPDLLGRVFLNLLDNATKHAPAGSVVTVDMTSWNGSHAVSVTDAGPGIAPDEQEAVFERYHRGDTAAAGGATVADGGAGLGLSIARRIAVAHGGQVVIADSRPGHTEFRVTIPRGD